MRLDETTVPIIDLAPARTGSPVDRAAVVDAVRQACERVGFLVITGHGVDESDVDALLDAARDFFAQPLETKLRAHHDEVYRGYTASEASALAASIGEETPPDLCELYTVNRFDDREEALRSGLIEGREGFFAPNIWPDDLPAVRPAFERYYGVMEELAGQLMGLFASALDLPEDWFEDKIRHHITNLTCQHYPAQDHPPVPGQLRRGAHTDWGSLTILRTTGEPGLQVRLDEEWHDVPHVPGSFVVNLGDLMAAWTNDRWVSTMHRVVNPATAEASTDRSSIAFFHQPTYDAVIECIPTCLGEGEEPRHDPTTSGEWILAKIRSSMGY
ncbi:MAG: 2-oxoglutarate and iron-dependent oxygenase domain-containing protein [Actinomycetota bacterium]